MELTDEAFSADGYIIAQRETGGLPFGARSSRENGCGWIAAYNLLRASLHPVRWDQVRRDLSRRLAFQGKDGLHLFALISYLKEKGCRICCASTLTGARLLADSCQAGIIMYGTGSSSHYVAFIRQPDGRLRFLNAGTGREDSTMTMREFYRDIVHFPLFFVLTVPA